MSKQNAAANFCDLSDGSEIFADILVRHMVMDQSFAIKNVSSKVFQDFFEYKLWWVIR